jgi:hypothetical protein
MGDAVLGLGHDGDNPPLIAKVRKYLDDPS